MVQPEVIKFQILSFLVFISLIIVFRALVLHGNRKVYAWSLENWSCLLSVLPLRVELGRKISHFLFFGFYLHVYCYKSYRIYLLVVANHMQGI